MLPRTGRRFRTDPSIQPASPPPGAVRHHRAVTANQSPRTTESCPGYGAVLIPLTDGGPSHPGASASCARLVEVTLRGLREEAAADPATAAVVALADAAYDAQPPVPADPATAAVVALADAAYDAQHPVPADPDRSRRAVDRLGAAQGADVGVGRK